VNTFTAITPQTFEGHTVHAITYKGRPVVLPTEHAHAIGADPEALMRLFRLLVERSEAEEGEDFIRLPYGEVQELRAKFDAERITGSNPIPSAARREMVALTREGAILLAMRSDAPRAAPFRKWAKKVLATVMETGRYEEADTPKPLTPPAELRRIGDRLWRAGKRYEATVCYLQAGETSLGRSFAAQAPAPAPVQVALPLQKPADPPAEITPETALWSAFVARWFKRFDATAIVHAGRLLEVVGDLFPLGDVGRDTKISRLNRILWDKAHQPIAGYQLEYRRSTRSGWSLVKV